MEALVLLVAVFVGYIIMYRLYGRFLARVVFRLNAKAEVPSKALEDGVDYVPTRRGVVFGHHFTSIAGTGPIVGPAVAIIWGWLPAVLWVFLGSLFMGAVHDFGSLVISLRNQGKSISDYTAKYISRRTRLLFFLIVFLELWIVIAVFGLVIALIFNIFPVSVFPVWMQILIAVILGIVLKRKGVNVLLSTLIAVVVMYLTVIAGAYWPFQMPELAGLPPTGLWTIILLIYAFIASVLPVTTLLQPRDYINAYQLMVAMILMVVGVIAATFVADMTMVAPAIQLHPKDAPPLWPFLFITIACGAISGFHSLVSSGTSAKQVANERDALFVGYGSMLVEGALATLVLIAVAAGIGLGYEKTLPDGSTSMLNGLPAWTAHYESWTAAKGLGSKLNAFVSGSANMIGTTGIPRRWALVVMGVFVASFAGTTLDTATRIQRYITTELFEGLGVKAFKNMYLATGFAVVTAAILAFATGADGKGALSLWPLFGVVNQTLAALALIVITLYLRQKSGWRWLVAGLPAVFMTVMTLWAAIMNEIQYTNDQSWLLLVVNSIVLLAVFVIAFEGIKRFLQLKGKTVTS